MHVCNANATYGLKYSFPLFLQTSFTCEPLGEDDLIFEQELAHSTSFGVAVRIQLHLLIIVTIPSQEPFLLEPMCMMVDGEKITSNTGITPLDFKPISKPQLHSVIHSVRYANAAAKLLSVCVAVTNIFANSSTNVSTNGIAHTAPDYPRQDKDRCRYARPQKQRTSPS